MPPLRTGESADFGQNQALRNQATAGGLAGSRRPRRDFVAPDGARTVERLDARATWRASRRRRTRTVRHRRPHRRIGLSLRDRRPGGASASSSLRRRLDCPAPGSTGRRGGAHALAAAGPRKGNATLAASPTRMATGSLSNWFPVQRLWRLRTQLVWPASTIKSLPAGEWIGRQETG
jgi:hypothetical protein